MKMQMSVIFTKKNFKRNISETKNIKKLDHCRYTDE